MPIPISISSHEMHTVCKSFKMIPHFSLRFFFSILLKNLSSLNHATSINWYYFRMMIQMRHFLEIFKHCNAKWLQLLTMIVPKLSKSCCHRPPSSTNAKLSAKWGQGWLLAFKDLSFWPCRLSKNTSGRWYSDWADWEKGVLRAPAFSSLSLALTLTEKLTYGRCPSMSRLKR